jgi:hypothetical protein
VENFLIKEGVGDMLRALHVDPMLQRTRLAIVFSVHLAALIPSSLVIMSDFFGIFHDELATCTLPWSTQSQTNLDLNC